MIFVAAAMKWLVLIVALSARADCEKEAQVCLEAQNECVAPGTRTDLLRCARFSSFCVRILDCTEQEKKEVLAVLRVAWWQSSFART